MAGFAADGGSIRCTLDGDEAALLARLLVELRAVIEEEVRGDPVTERLFPAAYEDRDDQAAYQDLVGDQLRTEKLEAIRAVESVLGPGPVDVTVPASEIGGWLPVLTDLRLAIGARLDVDESKMGRPIDPDDPDAAPMSILHWLGWMQESLLDALRRSEEPA
ncbi:MAG: DUF2017 family protein [Actinomycetota bacterium]